ncbi:MAG: sensor histidine kinase, partial [Lacrimispora sphenoides]
NGRGIDTEKAEASLFSQPREDGKRRHVGLNNIYQRLRAYYGTASITFDSIPYFQNTVRITVPYQP